jgi:hypothetical protein
VTIGDSHLGSERQEHVHSKGTFRAMTENTVQPGALRLGAEHRALMALAVAVAATAIVVAILLLRGHDNPSSLPALNDGPALVTQAQLEQLAAASDQPVYWAGPKPGYSYELTRTSNGHDYVRYLPASVKAGDPRANFLVVGTYAQPGSYANLQRAAKAPGALSLRIQNDGLVVFSSSKPTSVYLGYPGASYQVEVYSPSADSARRLVLADKIRPIR